MNKKKEFETVVNLIFGSLTLLAAIAAHPDATDALVGDGWKLWRQAAIAAFADLGHTEEQATAAIDVLVVVRLDENAPKSHIVAFRDHLEGACPGIFDHLRQNGV
jgi:hypothetical protein